MNKTLLPVNFVPAILSKKDPVNPDNWFFVEGEYDGFKQIWILERSKSNKYHAHSILSEDSFGSGYHENQSTTYVFDSLSEACCRIPGTAYPLFEGGILPEGESATIQDFRLLSTSTYNGTFYNNAKRQHDNVKCLDVVTHKTYSEKTDSYHEFKYEEYLNDIQEWFGLTHSERRRLKDSSIARQCALGFALEFDNEVFTLNSSSSNEFKTILKLRQKISDCVESLR
jgi:hypothetical protein